MATLSSIRRDIIPAYLHPVPSSKTLQRMFDKGGVRRLKSNPCALRGGGTCFYHLADIEKFFRSQTSAATNATARTQGAAR